MYRRPLQFAARSVAHVSACRAASAGGKALDQEACFRALAACQQAGVSSLLVTPCRTLHVATQLRNVKETRQHTEEEVGAFTKLIEAMGFTGPLKYNKWKIKIAALRMYTCCVERINYDEFFEKCTLPDTLNSWFLVAQLHVWMCLVRMRQEGREGKYMCRYIVHSMWEDVEQRSKIMGIDAIHRKEAMKAMTETFYAAIFGESCPMTVCWRRLCGETCSTVSVKTPDSSSSWWSTSANRCSTSTRWTGMTCCSQER
ncbi:unnamed protein product [Oreochromis niloticus]|nr:unnamed protein product [Mustela putorius furo]